jgi:dehydrogenase/reductase SDR family protein 7B
MQHPDMTEPVPRYFSGKRVWVTGASSGLGAAFVAALGAAGIETVASAPESECARIDTSCFPSVVVLPFDLTDRDGLSTVADQAWERFGNLDILINNAGISQRSLFAETDPAVLEQVIRVNLLGTMWLTREVVSRMVAQRSGHIVVISSWAAFVPVPQRTAYAAAKAGLLAMCDALRPELLEHSIDVTAVVPGTIRTEISLHAVTGDGSPHSTLDPNQEAGMSPEECAHRILKGVAARKRQFTVAVPVKLRYARFVKRLLPGLFTRLIARARVT